MRESFLTILSKRTEKIDDLLALLDSGDIKNLTKAWNSSYRWVGKELLNLNVEELELLQKINSDIDWSLWTNDELVRALVVIEGLKVDSEFFNKISRYFDFRETIAACRVVALLDDPSRYVFFATESCRSNSVDVFRAMALGNPFPYHHFSDLSFDQMVIKSMFLGLPLSPIVGLQKRKTSETRRMAQDYCEELSSAGRPMPVDIELVLETKKEQEV